MPSPSDYQMIIHTQRDAIGHFTVQLRGPDGKSIYRGFSPEDGKGILSASTVDVDGKVGDDEDKITRDGASIRSSRPISLKGEQFKNAKAFFEKSEKEWTKYDLDKHNCVDFVNESIKQAGLKGDVEDYLSQKQKDQMSGAAVYARSKYASSKPNTDRVSDRPGIRDDSQDSQTNTSGAPNDTPKPSGNDEVKGDSGGDAASGANGGSGKESLAAREPEEKQYSPEIRNFLEDLKKPADPVSDIMTKDIKDWTEDELRQVQGSKKYYQPSSPRRDEASGKVKSWYEHHYGNDPVRLDATGRTIQPEPKILPKTKPVPAKDKDGQPVLDGVMGAGAKIADLAGKRGLATAIRGAQTGLNLLHKLQTNGRSKNGALKADGLFGPKTKKSLTGSIAELGRPTVENALALGGFQNLMANKKGQAKGNLAEAAHDSFANLFQKPSTYNASDKKLKPWGIALQDTINDVGRSSFGNAFTPLKADGWIGPKTTSAFNKVFQPTGMGGFMKSFADKLGFF